MLGAITNYNGIVTEKHNSLCIPLDGNLTSKNNNDTFSNNQQPHLTLAIEFFSSFFLAFIAISVQCSTFHCETDVDVAEFVAIRILFLWAS